VKRWFNDRFWNQRLRRGVGPFYDSAGTHGAGDGRSMIIAATATKTTLSNWS
jgi:hypothetical protein